MCELVTRGEAQALVTTADWLAARALLARGLASYPVLAHRSWATYSIHNDRQVLVAPLAEPRKRWPSPAWWPRSRRPSSGSGARGLTWLTGRASSRPRF